MIKNYTNPNVLKQAEVVFLAVPTPMKPSGEMDYSVIYNSLTTLTTTTKKSPLVVVRSTAVPGTTESLETKYPFHFAFIQSS